MAEGYWGSNSCMTNWFTLDKATAVLPPTPPPNVPPQDIKFEFNPIEWSNNRPVASSGRAQQFKPNPNFLFSESSSNMA